MRFCFAKPALIPQRKEAFAYAKATVIKMNYKSTRDNKNTFFTSAEVIKKGLSDDGGLFVPEYIPTQTSEDIEKLAKLD